mgnify:CR=1 FL=1
MSKQSIKRKETQVSTSNGIGNQLEQTVTVDDSSLPSPEALAKYKEIDPQLVDFLIDVSKKEQEHRHLTDMKKLKIISNAESRTGRMNFFGMLFAFLSIIVFIGLAGFALYLNHPWFAGFFGLSSLVSIVSIFVNREDFKKTK